MKKIIYHSFTVFMLLALSLFLFGCGLLDGDDTDFSYDPFYDNPNYYTPGDSISGGDFTFTYVEVDVYLLDTSINEYTLISDGSYIPPGNHSFAVKTSSRIETNMFLSDFENISELLEGTPMDQRVYASDGGNQYLVEAFLNQETGFWEFDFIVDGTYITTTLLIEVLYPDRRARREKVVLNTRENVRPSQDRLVKEGVGVTINTESVVYEMLKGLQDYPGLIDVVMNLAMCNADTDVDTSNLTGLLDLITGVKPGSNSLMEMEVGELATVSIDIGDTFPEDNQKVKGPLDIEISLISEKPLVNWMLSAVNLFINTISLVSEPISMDFGGLLDPSSPTAAMLTDAMPAGNTTLTDMMEYMDLDLSAFINAFSTPEENTESLAALFVGIFLTPTSNLLTPEQLSLEGRCFPDWPLDATVDNTTHIDLSPIKSVNTDLGIALSQYQINSILSEVARNTVITLSPLVTRQVELIFRTYNPAAQKDRIYFNPNGLTVEFKEENGEIVTFLIGNDLIIEISENDVPTGIASLDIGFKITPKLHVENGNLLLDLTMAGLPKLMRCHVIDDTLDLGFTDHSSATKTLFEFILYGEVALEEGVVPEMNMSINLTDMGIHAAEDGTGLIVKDDNCYLNIALQDEGGCYLGDLQEIAGGCLISDLLF